MRKKTMNYQKQYLLLFKFIHENANNTNFCIQINKYIKPIGKLSSIQRYNKKRIWHWLLEKVNLIFCSAKIAKFMIINKNFVILGYWLWTMILWSSFNTFPINGLLLFCLIKLTKTNRWTKTPNPTFFFLMIFLMNFLLLQQLITHFTIFAVFFSVSAVN
jgi:hypothetical protein